MRIFMDGPNISEISESAPADVHGFTYNPTLMRKLGVADYGIYASAALTAAGDRPVSIQVLSDDPDDIVVEARRICWTRHNAWAKVPVIRTDGSMNRGLITMLLDEGQRINVTAIYEPRQTEGIVDHKNLILSVFAGHIEDSGRCAGYAVAELRKQFSKAAILWCATRSVYDAKRADQYGCQIITMSPELIKKMQVSRGRDLKTWSSDTVRQFAADAEGYTL